MQDFNMLRSPDKTLCLSQPNLNTTEENERQKNISSGKRKFAEIDGLAELKEDLKLMLLGFQAQQNEKYDQLNENIKAMKKQNDKLLNTNIEIEKTLKENTLNYNALKIKVEELEVEHKADQKKISSLEDQLDDVQKSLNKNLVEIRGVPRYDKEDLNKLMDTLNSGLNIDSSSNKIQQMFRKGKHNAPILIEYTETKYKNELLDAAKQYNKTNSKNKLNSTILGIDKENTAIYISEPLTQKARSIYTAAGKLRTDGLYKYLWTSRGKILIRKNDKAPVITLRSIEQVESLKMSDNNGITE